MRLSIEDKIALAVDDDTEQALSFSTQLLNEGFGFTAAHPPGGHLVLGVMYRG